MTSAAGRVVGTYQYAPYGTVTSLPRTVTSCARVRRVPTPTRRPASQYLQARYYDPATGQFLTVDPDVSLTAQAYAYAGGNPLNEIDPTGLSWFNPFSWHRLWHDVAVVAHDVAAIAKHVKTIAIGVALVAGAVALCAATPASATSPLLGISAEAADAFYATVEAGAETVEDWAYATAGGAEVVSPVAQRVEMFADAMNTAGYCGSDIGSGDCRQSATDLAVASARDYYMDSLQGSGEEPDEDTGAFE